MNNLKIEVEPLTLGVWPDFVTIMGPKGGNHGCWCMYLRLPGKIYSAQRGEANKQALHDLVSSGHPPGLLAYLDGQPAAWCATGSRSEFSRIERSPSLTRVDDRAVCSIPCLFVQQKYRGLGIAECMIERACSKARDWGYSVVEVYPYSCPPGKRLSADSSMFGTPSLFARLGFQEVAKRGNVRIIMRKEL